MPLHMNPVLIGFNPDPSIVRVADDYFMVTSTFEYFPGLPVYHSKDLISWTLIGHALNRRSQLEIRTVEPGSGIWAPTIRHHNGRFYLTSCSFTSYKPQQNASHRVWPRGFCVSTPDIWQSDSWSDPVYFDQPGFDQDLFWDDDERVYLSTCHRAVDHDPNSRLKGFAVHVSEVNLDTGRCLSSPVIVRRSASGVAEGSHIIKRNGYYYLFTAEGGTESGHSEWVFRSRAGPFGPWEHGPSNPLLSARLGDDVQNTGHADLVEDANGEWWAVCLAVRPSRVRHDDGSDGGFLPSPFGRESFLMKVKWVDNWPVFNGGRRLQLSFESHQEVVICDPDWRDDFENKDMALGWYSKNTPLKCEWSKTERAGFLRLWGGPYNLQSLESPTMLLRKQTFSTGVWTTRLDFSPRKETYEAGTVLYWNVYTSASIGIRKSRSGEMREIRFTRPTEAGPSNLSASTHALVNDGPVSLAIACSPSHYKLGYATDADGSDWTWFEDIPMQVMTADPPTGMAFTGMMLGLYAFGELEPCLVPADFAFAAWTEHVEDCDAVVPSGRVVA